MTDATTQPGARPDLAGLDPTLYNEDQLPTTAAERTWGWVSIAALWVGMVVCIPTYLLASYLIDSGMSWDQAVTTILLANAIVLIPMVLVGHAGTKYGIPFPVLLRSSFGLRGPRSQRLRAVLWPAAGSAFRHGWAGLRSL